MAEQGDRNTRQLLNVLVILSIVSVLGMIALAVGMFMVWAAKAQPQETKIIEQKPEPGKIYDLGVFVVNLADEDASRFVKAEIKLEHSKINLDLEREIKERTPQFQDLVNTLLNDRKASELATSEGKERFRRELELKINHLLKYGAITNIFLTQFAIQ